MKLDNKTSLKKSLKNAMASSDKKLSFYKKRLKNALIICDQCPDFDDCYNCPNYRAVEKAQALIEYEKKVKDGLIQRLNSLSK